MKSFKQLLQYPRQDEGKRNVLTLMLKKYETSRSDFPKAMSAGDVAPSRVFVTNDVIGMHLDWPLYSQQAESFATAAHIIVSDAAMVSFDAFKGETPWI